LIEIRGRKLGVEIKIKGAKPFALRCVYALIPLLQANYMISVLNMKSETQPSLYLFYSPYTQRNNTVIAGFQLRVKDMQKLHLASV